MEASTKAQGRLFVRDSRTSREYEIPITNNTVNASDFQKIELPTNGRSITKAKGLTVYDPGMENTVVKKTQIIGRDNATGLPLFRGVTSTELWDRKTDFEELFSLMVFGNYPSLIEKLALRYLFAEYMKEVPSVVGEVIRKFPPSSPPLPMLTAGLSAYLATNPDFIPAIHGGNIYHRNPRIADEAAIKTAALYAVVFAHVSCHKKGIDFVPADNDNSFLDNLFTMSGTVDPKTRKPDPNVLAAFRKGIVLNCDNGMTQSNVVLCATASSLCDPISCLISAISAAYGPLHYGAQEAGYRTLSEIGTPDRVPHFLEQVKRRERRLFGYGHRTFAVEDPRLTAVKGWLKELDLSSEKEPLMKVAEEIDRLAAEDDYFVSRGLRANADFYTLFVFRAYGFDWDMIGAANFCMRIIGFMAHWREAMEQEIKIFRARDLYVGPSKKEPDAKPKGNGIVAQARL